MEYLSSLKVFVEKHIKFFPLVIIFPSIIGGFWQIYELYLIDPSFIRFFSISQIVPDGLLILTITIPLILSCIIVSRFVNPRDLNKNGGNEERKFSYVKYFISLFLIFFALYIYVHLWIAIDKPSKVSQLKVSNLLAISLFIPAGIPFLLLGFIGCIKQISYCHPKTFKIINKNLINFFFKKNGKYYVLSKESIYFIFIFLLSFLAILLTLVISIRHQLINPSSITNFENVYNKVRENYSENIVPKLIYFNDKYIFIELQDCKSKDKKGSNFPVIILKLDDVLFEKK